MKRFALVTLSTLVSLAAHASGTAAPAPSAPAFVPPPVVGVVISVRPVIRDFTLLAENGRESMFRVTPATHVTVPTAAGGAATSSMASV